MTQSSPPQQSLRQIARRGIFWSMVQTWINRGFTFVLAVFLARLLSPQEFGIASAAMLALMLMPLIAEMGFGDSIMQRRDLNPIDVNLPFALACLTVTILIIGVIFFRYPIAVWAGIEGQSHFLVAIALTAIIAVPTAFQEAMYKRNMRFRDLALRAFVANLAGGLAALGAALAGFGIWTFVVQAWVTLIINVVWIWTRPQWLPSLDLDWAAFRHMLRFSLPVLAQRLVDFAGTRTLDIVIISQIGLAAYGLYIVGSRLYQTMMQLLQSAFYDVSLTVLSSIAHDRDRIATVYLQTIRFSAQAISALFILVAAIAPEISRVLFGSGWVGVETVMLPLMLMGSVHCVQYMNGAFLSARGRTELILITGVTKGVLQILAVLSIGGQTVTELTWVYVLATLSVAPLSFFMIGHELGLGLGRVLRPLIFPALASTACFVAVMLARYALMPNEFGSFVNGLVLAFIFVTTYLTITIVFDPAAAVILRSTLSRMRK